MDINLFRDLERLHHTGNFSQAAALGNISQPAFSRRIKALETWVGARLVDRSRQPVKLTAAGEQMLEAGTQALARLEQERSQIQELQSLPDTYVITFGAQHSIGWRFYPAWLHALEEAYGPVLSRLRADDLPNCLRDLGAGDVDFVTAYGDGPPAGDRSLEAIAIGTDQLVPVCKPATAGTPLFPLDEGGAKTPYLRFGDTAPISGFLEPLFAAQNLPARLTTVYENSMAGALRMRARAGDGVAWLPLSLVQPDLDSGQLCRTGRPDWAIALTIQLLRGKERPNRTTNALWSFLNLRQSVPLVALV